MAEVRASTPEATSRRGLEGIYPAPGFHWVGDGFRVAGYFSAIPDAAKKLDPFLLLDYHPVHEYPPSQRRRGVGSHPHRGFETVTLAWHGSVAHRDSSGGGGVIGPGDVQWMTAASGVVHEEFHEQRWAEQGGPFQMAQLWVNLPRRHKMDPPRYQALASADMGVVERPGVRVRVVAGELDGARGPARTFTPIQLYDARLDAGARLDLSFPVGHNVGLLVMQGAVTIGGSANARTHDFVVFDHAGERVELEATAEAQLLVLGGEPIGEPVVQYGPFVMNSEQEIVEAIADFNAGRFGRL